MSQESKPREFSVFVTVGKEPKEKLEVFNYRKGHDQSVNVIRTIEYSAYEQQALELKRANDILRSCYQVAARRGDQTNWEALLNRIEQALKSKQEFLK